MHVGSVFVRCLIGLGGCVLFGTAFHEIVGHGTVGLALGGHLEHLRVLGVRLYPQLAWMGLGGVFGDCSVVGLDHDWQYDLVSLGGSMSTWCVSVVAVSLLWWRDWPARRRYLLAWASLWWIDLFTYTLPSFGLRRFVIAGRHFDEPYQAAVALGLPGPAFQGFVFCTCTILALALLFRLRRRPAYAAGPQI